MASLTRRSPEWIADAPILVEESIEIDAHASAVWAHIADHERWPEWFDALDEVTVTHAPTGTDGGRRVSAGPLWLEEEFTAWDEGSHFAFTIVRSNLFVLAAMAESVRLAPLDDGARTHVTYRQGLEGRRGTGRMLAMLWSRTVPGMRTALEALRERSEAA